ncbi:MAG: hypothetical protein OXG35_14980 [Acidobacteria bacterium]|nr:hypothetical protein [Acidobacteriota bacterium]
MDFSEWIRALTVLEMATFSGIANLLVVVLVLWLTIDARKRSVSWSTVVMVPVFAALMLVPLLVCMATIHFIGLP